MSIPFEMIMSSITILVLVFVMAAIFMRAKQPVYAYSIFPVALLPAMHLIGGYVSKRFKDILSFSPFSVYVFFIIVALIAVFILSGISCSKIKSISRRILMLVMLFGFSLIYAAICIFNLPTSAI